VRQENLRWQTTRQGDRSGSGLPRQGEAVGGSEDSADTSVASRHEFAAGASMLVWRRDTRWPQVPPLSAGREQAAGTGHGRFAQGSGDTVLLEWKGTGPGRGTVWFLGGTGKFKGIQGRLATRFRHCAPPALRSGDLYLAFSQGTKPLVSHSAPSPW